MTRDYKIYITGGIMIYKPKNILVTGAAGFIGCNYVHYMLEQYNDVNIISYDSLTYAAQQKYLPEETEQNIFIEGDICNRELVDRVLRNYDIDTIIHFAAESHVDRSITDPSVFVTTNILGTFTLLEAAKQFWLEEKSLSKNDCCFHHISTDEVYGQLTLEDPGFAETTPYNPSSPYSASKASSDHFVNAYFHTYGLPITMSNCSNNYGPYQHDEKLIPTVIRHCVNKTSIPVYGNGSNIRDWLFVKDHCLAIDMIVRNGKRGESYNVGGNCERDNLTLVRKICSIMDDLTPYDQEHEQLISFVTDRPGHDWRYAIDNTKIVNELDFVPQETFDTGILKTIMWYLNKYKVKSSTLTLSRSYDSI
jgi:dTDP-glucose 4,6-dehydratase